MTLRRTRFFLRSARPAALGVAILATGCASGPPRPVKDAHAYQGPPIRIVSSEAGATASPAGVGLNPPQHLLILSAPTAGWSFMLDSTQDAFQRREVFVTVMRPNPAYPGVQAPVEQRLATEAALRTPIDVYVRVIDYTLKPQPGAYRFAGRSDQ